MLGRGQATITATGEGHTATTVVNVTGGVATTRAADTPDDIPMTTNQRVRRTFTTAGEFPVVCTVHPGMTARVVVRP